MSILDHIPARSELRSDGDPSQQPEEQAPRFKESCCMKYTVEKERQMREERSETKESSRSEGAEVEGSESEIRKANYRSRRASPFSEQCKRCPFRQISDEAEQEKALNQCQERRRGHYKWYDEDNDVEVKIEYNNQYR